MVAQRHCAWVSSATLKSGILDHSSIKTVYIWPSSYFEQWFHLREWHVEVGRGHMSAPFPPLYLIWPSKTAAADRLTVVFLPLASHTAAGVAPTTSTQQGKFNGVSCG